MPMYDADNVYWLRDVDDRSFCFTLDQVKSVEPALTGDGEHVWITLCDGASWQHLKRVERAAVEVYPELAALICEAVDAHWREHGPKLLEALRRTLYGCRQASIFTRAELDEINNAIAAAEHLPGVTE